MERVAFELGVEEGRGSPPWKGGLLEILMCSQVADEVRVPGAWKLGQIVWKVGWG